MNFLFTIGLFTVWGGTADPTSLFDPSSLIPGGLREETFSDSLNLKIFDSEQDFELFITGVYDGDDGGSFNLLESGQKDSLFQLLNRNKKLIIPKIYLGNFSDYVLPEQDVQRIMEQSLALLPKDKELKYTFEAREGDHFFIKFDSSKGGGHGTGVEVLFNGVRVSGELVFSRKKGFAFDFVPSRPGKIELVFRNFGFFKVQGDITVEVEPRKEKIQIQEIKQIERFKKDIQISVKDTLYKMLFDESILISHKLNLKGNSVFEQELDLVTEGDLLGFAIFLYPDSHKEKLESQRREVYRQDPLQDFAFKELTGRSYTYLPEYDFVDLDLSIIDYTGKSHWLNGEIKAGNSLKSSSNSKKNYAFFEARRELEDSKTHVRISNRSALYNRELWLQVVALFEGAFRITESVEVQESKEFIILTLL